MNEYIVGAFFLGISFCIIVLYLYDVFKGYQKKKRNSEYWKIQESINKSATVSRKARESIHINMRGLEESMNNHLSALDGRLIRLENKQERVKK